MKRVIAIFLITALLFWTAVIPINAEYLPDENILQLLSALEIMQGDENGNFNLDKNLTRAEFVKLVINASVYKDMVSPVANTSPFSDVSFTHWAASYIKTAVSKGFVMGYSDGTFRPDNFITLEEAVSAVLRMVGYQTNDFSGSFPYAQLAIYESLGLSQNVVAKQGEYITRRDAMYLFYNLLNSTPKNYNSKYITSLGYKLDANGEIDFIGIITANTEGPITVKTANWYEGLGLHTGSLNVYRDGVKVTLNDIEKFDIIYYSRTMNSLWAYSKKVTGIYESAAPNKDSLTSITVSGVTYQVETITAFNKLSSDGIFNFGDTITLLLSRDGKVADVISPFDMDSAEVYGFVTDSGKKLIADISGSKSSKNYVVVTLTSGETGEFVTEYEIKPGTVVSITYGKNGAEVKNLYRYGTASGLFDYEGKTIGNFKMSAGIRILDTYENRCIKIYPQRLDGTEIDPEKVLFAKTNREGMIEDLILKDHTGDLYNYGLLTLADEVVKTVERQTTVKGTYIINVNGKESSFTTNGKIYNVSTGAVGFISQNMQSFDVLWNLKRIYENFTSVNEVYIKSDKNTYKLSSDLQVYISENYKYRTATISDIKDKGKFEYLPFIDRAEKDGGRVRVIIAVAK